MYDKEKVKLFMSNMLNLRKNKNETALTFLDSEKLKEFLKQINMGLMESNVPVSEEDYLFADTHGMNFIEDSEAEVLQDGMMVGRYSAPPLSVSEKIISNFADDMQDKKFQNLGKIIYYLVIGLHMFSDRNGRTARFAYDFVKGNFLEKPNTIYYFKNSPSSRSSNISTSFEKAREIESPEKVLSETYIKLTEEPFLSSLISKYGIKGVQLTATYNEECPEEGIVVERKLRQIANGTLSPKEISELGHYFCEGSLPYSPLGIAMLIMHDKKNTAESIISDSSGYINFSQFLDYINDWSGEDLKELLELAKKYQIMAFDILVKTLKGKTFVFDAGTTDSMNRGKNIK